MAADAIDSTEGPRLLLTKLHAPGRRRGTIGRARLTSDTAGRDQPRLTLVSAPAGFGKTTLLTDWYASDEAGPGTAWLSLDARDNDPATFWAYVIAALRTVAPDLGGPALAHLRSAAVDAAVEALAADLQALDEDVALVLDDYHVIESPEIHDGIAFLLEHLPPRVGLVLATRVDPPLPLARLRASGDLVERRAGDLRFTRAEAARYLNESMGLELTDDDVGALEARTEGWIAALQLAALSLQGREDVAGFIETFTGDDRFVVDYLVEEVLERQPDEVRRFLLETAVLNRLTGPLCDAVTGSTGGRAMLERLDRGNLFLVPLDDRRRWYRYHHLFADVLRARLLDEEPQLLPTLHRRAAGWWTDSDDRVEAIAHALAGEDVDRAAELIELAAPGLHRIRQEAVVRAWLEALPDTAFDRRPVLAVLLVGARMSTGDPSGVERLLTSVESWLGDDGHERAGDGPLIVDHEYFARLPEQVAVYRAALALLSGDIDGTIRHSDRALALARPDDNLRLGSATALGGLAHWTTGDLERARAHYALAVDHLVRAGHFADALGCSLGLADMCIAQGRLADAERAFTFGLDLLREHPGLRGAADMHAGLSEIFLQRRQLDRAQDHLDASAALGEQAGLPQHPYRWRVATALLLQAHGDHDEALVLLDEAERLYNTDFSPAVRPVSALKARAALARGDVDGAVRWAEGVGPGADDEVSYVREFEHLTLARTLVALEVRDRTDRGAAALLERLLAAAEAGGRSGAVVESLVLLSMARQAAGDRAAALAAMERALDLAAPEGLVGVFVDEGAPVAALLRSSTFDGVAGHHAVRAQAAFTGAMPRPSQHGLVDELSSRELDVLRLLRSELSGPEIARELIVSLNTLRTHTKNIYAKLGVGNRREAVRRADELGL